MSDSPEISTDPNTAGNANLIYILHLASILVGVTSIVGVIMAYMAKDEAAPMPLFQPDQSVLEIHALHGCRRGSFYYLDWLLGHALGRCMVRHPQHQRHGRARPRRSH